MVRWTKAYLPSGLVIDYDADAPENQGSQGIDETLVDMSEPWTPEPVLEDDNFQTRFIKSCGPPREKKYPFNGWTNEQWASQSLASRHESLVSWHGADKVMRMEARFAAGETRRSASLVYKPPKSRKVKRRTDESYSIEETFSYDRETGQIRRRGTDLSVVSIDTRGYAYVLYAGKLILAQRLAWFMVTGSWPAKPVKHANWVRADNRWVNLALVDTVKRYQAKAMTKGVRVSLGYFATALERDAAVVNHKLGLTP
jgi:hypothetical protein